VKGKVEDKKGKVGGFGEMQGSGARVTLPGSNTTCVKKGGGRERLHQRGGLGCAGGVWNNDDDWVRAKNGRKTGDISWHGGGGGGGCYY